MKRFRWPLQRLLDVTVQREQAARSALMHLTAQVTAARGEVLRLHMRQRQQLRELAALDIRTRIDRLTFYRPALEADGQALDRLSARIAALEARRAETAGTLREHRRSRQMHERLREEAWREHRAAADREEQKQLDESAALRFARDLGVRAAAL